MSLKKYEAFYKSVELGSLSRAAKELNRTQSALSHMIASLETELGFTLLSRTSNGVKATKEAMILMPSIKALLNAKNEIDDLAKSIKSHDTGLVRIGAFTSVAVHWLPSIIKNFQRDYPNVEIELLNGDYHDVLRWLEEGSVDLAFIRATDDTDYSYKVLAEDRLMAVLPKSHKYAKNEKFDIKNIDGEDYISLNETSNQDARSSYESVGVKPNIKFTTKDDYAIIAMVEQGLGMSIMPELLLRNRGENVAILELYPHMSRKIALAIPHSQKISLSAEKFSEYVEAWVKENC